MASPNRSDNITIPVRHKLYYIDNADLHILVANVLFRVHGYFFSRDSSEFNKKLNPASPGNVKEGANDNTPVILKDIKPEAFEKLCWVFYNPKYSLYDASVGDWKDILSLADKWDFSEVKELAVRELHKKPDLDIVGKMELYQTYKVDKRHLVPLYAVLCQRDTPLTLDESKTLGMEATVLVNTAREKLRASPSHEGRSPLPVGLEEGDVFRALEKELEIEEGATAQFLSTNAQAHPNGTERDPKHKNNHHKRGSRIR